MSELKLSQVDYELTPSGYQPIEGEPDSLRGVHAPTVEYDALVDRFNEGNDTYRVVKGPSGRLYEIVLFNADKRSQAVVLKPSTSGSSARKNPGNMLETALEAAANPGMAYGYVASFGAHPTGHMSLRDLLYVSKKARYTTGDGSPKKPYRPIGSIVDMAETVADSVGLPTHMTADAEAGRIALGLMAAFPADTIKAANLNGLDGVSKNAAYVRSHATEDILSRIARRRIGAGKPGEVTPVNIKDVKKHMPNIYSGLGRIAHIAPLPVFLYPKDYRDVAMITLGYMGHNNLGDLGNHAVFHDMQAALRQQDATILLQFAKESDNHNIDDCKEFGKLVLNHLPVMLRDDKRKVRLLISEGKQDWHTEDPHGRARIDRLAFPDVMHKMAVYAGDLLTDTQIFDLPPVKVSAS